MQGRSQSRRSTVAFAATMVWAIGCALGYTVPASAAAQRIVSMNLCTDQLALMLVDRSRIVSISFLGADPAESPLADFAKGVPINHGQAEEVIAQKPDLVLTGRYTTGFAKAMLRRLKYRVVEIDSPRTLPAIHDVTRAVGMAVGEEERADALLADMDRRLATVAEEARRHPRYTAITYDANGYTVGRPGVTDDVMSIAGLDNLAPSLGIGEYGNIPLETMLIARPARILHLVYRPGVPSLADAMMQHPALLARTRDTPMLTVRGNLLTCATPMVATAAEQIAAALEKTQ